MVPGKTKRKIDYVFDVEMNSLLINCRSLKPKLSSLITNFKMNKNTVAILNETWFKKGDKQLKVLLEGIQMEHNIAFIRKDRSSRGGGVAIAYDTNKIELKKIQLRSLCGKNFEIVAAAGKIVGVKKSQVIISTYLPPNYSRDENADFMEAVCDSLLEIKRLYPGSWITIGGDWNGRNLSPILDLSLIHI